MPHVLKMKDGKLLTHFGIRDLLDAVKDYAGEELRREIEEYIETNVQDIDDYEKEYDRMEQENERLADHQRSVLCNIREELDALDTLLQDTRLNRRRMQGAVRIIRQMINHLTTNQQEVFGTTSLFHRQVASALGIPAKYYDLMQAQKPELLAENVNSWFADKPSSYMVRSMDYGAGQVARALLSERYRRIDNMEIATAVLPLFAGNDQYEVMSCEVTESRLYLKVVNHRLEMEVRKGDIVQAGVMISNSEVGLGAVSIQPLVYRLVCTNGMVVNDMGERRHHVGRQAKAVEDSFALYSDETMEAEDKAFLLKLRDTTMAAIDEARFSQVVGRLQESMAVPITGRVQDVVQLTAQSYGINAEEQEGILKYLIEGGDLSLYGLSNAVTRASQDVVSYDRATTLEGIGWQVATMEPQQWKQINQ